MVDITSKVLLCSVILLCASGDSAQVVTPKTSLRTLDVVVADLLKAARVPGGIEVMRGCNDLESKPFEVATVPISAALTNLSEVERTLTWHKIGAGYLVTITSVGSPRVTSAEIPALQLKAKTLTEASDILLQEQATRNRIAGLKLSEGPSNIGFSSIHDRDRRGISLPAGTLRDDLNALATAFGPAIWQLDQRECGGRRSFRLSWIAK
jgi:hypothetical protein